MRPVSTIVSRAAVAASRMVAPAGRVPSAVSAP
jgi:hypothetical protein